MKSLFEDFNAKVGKEGGIKPVIKNESSCGISNDNRIKVVYYGT
jgi:hypothetical protein